eukprot:XP_014042355.1 PREDICTED: exportin-T-like [Salmo salar]
MGQSLVLSWTKQAKGGEVKDAAESLRAIEAKVPLLLQLLVHDDDDISANIVGFCYDYLNVLKQGSEWQSNMLQVGRGGQEAIEEYWESDKFPLLTDQQKTNVEVRFHQELFGAGFPDTQIRP